MKYTIRTANNRDIDFLDELYTANMKGYVERVCKWEPCMFRQYFDPVEIQVIEVERRPVGFTRLVKKGDELYLAEVQIASKYQNQGLGTAIVRSAIDEAQRLDALLILKVIKGNPAESLYRRMGFRVYAETDIHRKMSKAPCGCSRISGR